MRSIDWPDIGEISGLSDHQFEVASDLFCDRIAVLTGGPGVGKTHTGAAILKAIYNARPDDLAVAAPTGKAAVRIQAAMQAYGMEIEAKTIHRMLRVTRNGYDGKGWGFASNANNPIPEKYIVVDEISMLDTDLAASLFDALRPDAHVLLIGDPGQLPPVGHGAPLRDFLAAGVPHGELTEIHRNMGDIVLACAAIREGRRWQPSLGLNVSAGRNLLHHESRSPVHTIREIERLFTSFPAGLSPLWDVQVMCAVNEKSPLSRKELNKRLQAILNPTKGEGEKRKLRNRDKVICLSNSWLAAAESWPEIGNVGELPEEFVANGEIGQVVGFHENRFTVVRFDNPRRHVLFGPKEKDDIDLAYAITVHKSQGSQWPVAIYVSDDYAGARYVASRELIYTALSRAEKLAITIGRKATMDADCRRESLSKRKTFLAERVAVA